ncbi:MAG TPA: HEAT repeat domain-containing protein [Phycisphaerae bacterium]|nr:HEAT repeat domain-containing protein [Phycisphaerae bacterium]
MMLAEGTLLLKGGTLRRLGWAALLLVCLAPAARGDIFHMKGGDKIEVEILEEVGEVYRVRTSIGVVDIDKAEVVRIEKAPSPWKVYEEKNKECPNTAAGHYALAEWCDGHGLSSERVEHLKTVIKLDPEHVAARRDLGYVKKDGAWVKERTTSAPGSEDREAKRRANEEERVVRELVSGWLLQVKGIYQGSLQGGDPQSAKFRRGREQILAIRDPFAVPAITSVLSTGNVAARRVMVEALAQFDEDEATMNLLVVTLLDPAADVRKQAAVELVRRKDERVVERLREALRSNEEFILRNAATALGVFKARSAIEDLVAVLSTEELRQVYVTRPVMVDNVWLAFGGPGRYRHGGRMLSYRPRSIGVLAPANTMIGTEGAYEVQSVSIYRTEVQEALIAITGQNFGFDRDAWLTWWRDQRR